MTSDAKITLYEHSGFGGRRIDVTEATPDLVNLGFNDITSSVIVEKGVWVLYTEKNYQGFIYVVIQGERVDLGAMGWNDRASSLKPLDFDFSQKPTCTLYETFNFSGRSLHLTSDARNLAWYNFNDLTQSIKVQSGAWVAYNDADYRGRQFLFLTGDHQDKTLFFGLKWKQISSLRGIQVVPSGPIELVNIEFNLTSGILSTTPEVVFTWTQRNDTDVAQSLSISEQKSVSKSNTYEFQWDQGSSISASMEVSIGIPEIGLGSKLTLGATSTRNIGKTKGEQTSKTETWKVDFPSTIPPRSIVVVKSTVTRGKMDVPFKAVLRQENHSWTEHGKFLGVDYYAFTTSFDQKEL